MIVVEVLFKVDKERECEGEMRERRMEFFSNRYYGQRCVIFLVLW